MSALACWQQLKFVLGNVANARLIAGFNHVLRPS
jgi:hypothetical protein